jgi:AcrR family transcriptional regulator
MLSANEPAHSDPHRSMALLWRTEQPPRRGPKPRLSVDEIVRAAIQLADADGLAALSMRRVGEALGVRAMSLYTYVPGKAELLDVMIDTVHGEVARTAGVPGGWRARLALCAREVWALYQRHPWLLQIITTRPVLGPNIIAQYEDLLQAVDGLGLTELEMDGVATLLADYVHGAARGAVDAAEAEQRTGLTDEAWWMAYEPLLKDVFQSRQFPLAMRVGHIAGETHQSTYHAEYAFTFGLERVLDGIAAMIRAHEADPA